MFDGARDNAKILNCILTLAEYPIPHVSTSKLMFVTASRRLFENALKEFAPATNEYSKTYYLLSMKPKFFLKMF